VEWERGYRQGGLVVRRLVRAKGGEGDERGEMRGGKREWRKEGGREGETGREKDYFFCTFIAYIVFVWSLFITCGNNWETMS